MTTDKLQIKILELFKLKHHSELSTSEIVHAVESNEIKLINSILNEKFVDPEKIKQAKRKKAQLHRKILYHLNYLIKQGILYVTKEGKKGEKYFALDLEEGEEIIIDKFRRRNTIILSKPKSPSMPIEGYEQRGILHKLEPNTWIERLNSLLVECSMFKNLNELLHFINTCFSSINDTIALNDFELLFVSHDVNQIISFVHKLNTRCIDYGKKAALVFDITNFTNEQNIITFIKDYQNTKTKNIYLIFDVKVREFQEYSAFFEHIIKIFSLSNTDLYIKNQDLHKAPYLLGRAGPYTFDEQEWLMYKKELQRNLKCLVCTQATVMVDADKFFQEEKRDIESFKLFNLKIANALLSSNSIQRRRAEEFYSDLIKLNQEHTKDIFIFSKNYIRFWNYGWKRDDFDQDFLIQLYKTSKSAIDKFCISEETIYKSCGMPTRFKIALSICFEEFVKNIFSKAKYKRFHITGLKDFYKEEIKQILEAKENLFNVFDGGDLISFYRVGNLNTIDIIREISFILNTYKFHFFRWNFGSTKETDLSLTRFFK